MCPHDVIDILGGTEAKPLVLCHNTEKGAVTNKECQTGCIGCMKCQKACPTEAIKVENFWPASTMKPASAAASAWRFGPKGVIVKQ